jgi:hypothetical protein
VKSNDILIFLIDEFFYYLKVSALLALRETERMSVQKGKKKTKAKDWPINNFLCVM